MSQFKLLIDRLTDRPQHFEFEARPQWWARLAGETDRPGEGEIDRPFRFELAASRVGEDVLIDGSLEGGMSAECSRCTRRYAHALREPFRLLLEPFKEDMRGAARADEALDPEGERAIAANGICLGDDIEAGWFRGPVIFLDDFFAEVVATAMPIQPLCNEDCLGLCPRCGLERGSERGAAESEVDGSAPGMPATPKMLGEQTAAVCTCTDERVESPFAVLANWKTKANEKSESESSAAKSTGKSRVETANETGSRKRS